MTDLLLELLRFAVLAGLGVFVIRALQVMRADLRDAAAAPHHPSRAPRRRSPRLIVEAGAGKLRPGQAFPIEGDMVVGRSPAAHLVLADRFVSLRHARLTVQDATVLVDDLGSSNGTFVNDERVGSSARLTEGDRLRIGSVVLRLQWPASS
ncbi:MAG TPA: FHA domain-containing protein [Gemmatimonadales bacterium]|nr:FHA domain-containing protein [Gemmatimonadales bacterium]